MDVDRITARIISAAIEVHRHLGPGLLESVYQVCLLKELEVAGLSYESEVPVHVAYKGEMVGEGYRIDVMVENEVVVELKAVEMLQDKHKAQLLTYLKLMGKRVGLLINFNEAVLKNGIRRVVNNY